jgi:hypothetical protein
MEWTNSAREELDKYFDQIRPNLQATGADPAEVLDDIRRHIDEELTALKLEIVTAEDVKRVVLKMGLPGLSSHPVSNKPPELNSLLSKSTGILSDSIILIFGVILPAAAFGIELITHMCGRTFFDPIPTVWHCILAGFVPLSSLLVWLAIKRNKYSYIRILGFVNAVAIGISFFYTLLYLPLLPLAAIAILIYGLGLLPMAPLAAFTNALILRRRLRKASQSLGCAKAFGLWRGVALGIGLLIIIEMPSAITRLGLEMAKSESPAASLRGIKLLRAAGNQDSMLRLCYQRSGRSTDLISFVFSLRDPIVPNEARTIFYRVKGIPFNSLPAPALSSRGEGDFFNAWDFDFDENQGGNAVAGVLKGLSLGSSRIDTSIDANAVLAYTEWTVEFQNKAEIEQEARAQIDLPPNGIVSRLTLWINGEEREAAFAGRGKVRDAYQKVVERRRDPVLVTTSGTNRILMQCFPVPPRGGTMKVRIGISSPLILRDTTKGYYQLPHIIERNFKIASDLTHSVWVEAKNPIQSDNKCFVSEQPKKEFFALRGALKDADMTKSETIISAARAPENLRAWTPDPLSHGAQVIKQEIIEKETDTPGHVVIVIDGSNSLKDFSSSIIHAIQSIPKQITPLLIIASDEATDDQSPVRSIDLAGSPNLDDVLDKSKFVGGQDNVPALLKAWEEASSREHGVILWVHGPQPILMKSVEELRQRWERRTGGPKIVELPVVYGPNRILEQLDGVPYVESMPRLADVKSDLAFLFSNYSSAHRNLDFKREKVGSKIFSASAAKETSSHLARLWAYDEVMRLVSLKGKMPPNGAILVAANYHIVTPVSGAVVLENRQQYAAAGLDPANPSTVPTIPEPRVWLLVAAVAALLLLLPLVRKIQCVLIKSQT